MRIIDCFETLYLKGQFMNDLFETAGFKKSLYKHLEGIDLNAVYSFCKSESFEVIVSGYLSTEENSQEKKDAISAFISEHIDKDLRSIAKQGEIEYLVLDLDFLYDALPYFKELIEIKEVHELHYILKKGIILKNTENKFANKKYIQNLFYHTGCFYNEYENCIKSIVNNINFETLIQPKRCLEYCYENKSMFFSSDWKGRPNAPEEVVSILKFASNKLKGNKTLFKQLINHDYYLIRYLDKEINNDKILFKSARRIWLKITKELIGDGSGIIIDIDKYYPMQYFKFAYDREIVLLSVSDLGSNLKIVDKFLQDDDFVVLEAVTNKGGALEFASERLRDNEEIVLAAIAVSNNNVLKYASDRLKIKYGYVDKKDIEDDDLPF